MEPPDEHAVILGVSCCGKVNIPEGEDVGGALSSWEGKSSTSEQHLQRYVSCGYLHRHHLLVVVAVDHWCGSFLPCNKPPLLVVMHRQGFVVAHVERLLVSPCLVHPAKQDAGCLLPQVCPGRRTDGTSGTSTVRTDEHALLWCCCCCCWVLVRFPQGGFPDLLSCY